MDIYTYLNLINDLGGLRLRVYDLVNEKCIFDKKNCDCDGGLMSELEEAGLDYRELWGVDIYTDGSDLVMECNVEMDEEEDDD